MPDILAVIRVGMISSFGRNPEKHKAVTRARAEFVETARYMGGLKEDSDFKVAIYDLEGTSGDAYWDAVGTFDKETQKEIPLLEIEEIRVTAKETKPRKRR